MVFKEEVGGLYFPISKFLIKPQFVIWGVIGAQGSGVECRNMSANMSKLDFR